MTSSDRFPVPVRSAVKSNLTDWCFQNLSKRALNALTVQASTTELGKLFQIFTMRAVVVHKTMSMLLNARHTQRHRRKPAKVYVVTPWYRYRRSKFQVSHNTTVQCVEHRHRIDKYRPAAEGSIMASLTKLVILSALLTMFCFGIYDVLKNYEDNACEMTYMFEVPEYMVRNGYNADMPPIDDR